MNYKHFNLKKIFKSPDFPKVFFIGFPLLVLLIIDGLSIKFQFFISDESEYFLDALNSRLVNFYIYFITGIIAMVYYFYFQKDEKKEYIERIFEFWLIPLLYLDKIVEGAIILYFKNYFQNLDIKSLFQNANEFKSGEHVRFYIFLVVLLLNVIVNKIYIKRKQIIS